MLKFVGIYYPREALLLREKLFFGIFRVFQGISHNEGKLFEFCPERLRIFWKILFFLDLEYFLQNCSELKFLFCYANIALQTNIMQYFNHTASVDKQLRAMEFHFHSPMEYFPPKMLRSLTLLAPGRGSSSLCLDKFDFNVFLIRHFFRSSMTFPGIYLG